MAATPVDELGLSLPDQVIGGLLPLLLAAPFFWSVTARVRRILRWGLRSSAVVLVVNVLALPNIRRPRHPPATRPPRSSCS